MFSFVPFLPDTKNKQKKDVKKDSPIAADYIGPLRVLLEPALTKLAFGLVFHERKKPNAQTVVRRFLFSHRCSARSQGVGASL
jgi:hypothetical protein